MFRKAARKALMQLAEEQSELPEVIRVQDSKRSMLTLRSTRTGDISVTTSYCGVTFAGIGGDDDRPLTKEALRLLALAMQVEQ
jgi:hypothetical protein